MRIELATDYYPRCTQWHVQRALKWIPPADLAGIEYIRVMDEQPTSCKVPDQPAYLRGFTYNGQYVKKNQATGTHINLYTRDLYIGVPYLFKFTPMATLNIAETLAHEVGHHLIADRGYLYEPTEKYKPHVTYDEYEEAMANSYASDIVRKMAAHRYYKLWQGVRRAISNQYYERGVVVWENGEYERAAYYWFCAYQINSDHLNAAQWYQKARTILKLPPLNEIKLR